MKFKGKYHLRDWPFFYNLRLLRNQDKTLCGKFRVRIPEQDSFSEEMEKRAIERKDKDINRICNNCRNIYGNVKSNIKRLKSYRKELASNNENQKAA